MIVYLDDILIMAQSPQLVLQHLRMTMFTLQNLGFVINEAKSILYPSQQTVFLGFVIDSQSAQPSLPRSKLRDIKELRALLSKQTVSLRVIARIVGLLASSIQAIFPGPLHYRALQRLKICHLQRGLSYTDMVPLSQEVREEIQWWLGHVNAWNSRAIFGSQPEVVIESDASRWG